MWCIGGRLASPTGLRVLLIVALAQSGCQAHGGTRSGRLRAASESGCLGMQP
ncbi:hypothetical protein DPMN_131360 [Dreissena polymorpha]|uniref:Uncharacterized protein n=1 Tax=Dreissena polymorpha TaxID=45954 RepID=A0A9D4H9H5_DREPO|nr:hypothetical protein DPMN_131360 [Dreissena polymorpha]